MTVHDLMDALRLCLAGVVFGALAGLAAGAVAASALRRWWVR